MSHSGIVTEDVVESEYVSWEFHYTRANAAVGSVPMSGREDEARWVEHFTDEQYGDAPHPNPVVFYRLSKTVGYSHRRQRLV